MKTIKLQISGMDCASCGKIIRMTVNELPGIRNITISESGAAEIETEDDVDVAAVLAKVKEAGYEATVK
jgi:copper chaperone CopZ